MTSESLHEIVIRVVEIIAAFAMLSGVWLFYYRIKRAPTGITKWPPLGARAVQFVTVTMGVPPILILGLEKVLDGAVVGTLLGGLFGYVLSHVGRFEPRGKAGSDPDLAE
jgi:hypothetical protein